MKNLKLNPVNFSTTIILSGFALGTTSAVAQTIKPSDQGSMSANIVVHLDQPAKPISPDLFGIFFEDLNYAADGGLYAQLVQNRSFEYSSADRKEWQSLTAWDPVIREGGQGTVTVETAEPLNANNPHYAVVTVDRAGGGVGLMNTGFDGIAVKAGDKYDFSVFSRKLSGPAAPLVVQLETKAGATIAQAKLAVPTASWAKSNCILQPIADATDARLILLTTGTGAVAFDEISLFPQNTFHNRPNGLRVDIAQAIVDLHPKFVRFPGGCLVHGDGVANFYHWKDTIGPVEQRKGQLNIWRYHQSVGLGYFEYFQFCEDIGAKPLPVVAAGVCCQNSGFLVTRKYGIGQQGLPMEQMPAYIQDVLDLVEYANGPVTSTWGAKRAAAGHPEPFHLQYLGVGNEDAQTPVFRERFKMIYDALKVKCPNITIVGTVGPSPAGRDYDEGWKFANELGIDMVDEHYYEDPGWFLKNMNRYDSYDRAHSKVYVGEYASRGNTMGNALAEAAYMTSLERNGDVVQMASYAPLLCNVKHVQWSPDMIYFSNTAVFPSVNYYVQQLFCSNTGDGYLASDVRAAESATKETRTAFSALSDSKSGDLILKLVNLSSTPLQAKVQLEGVAGIQPDAQCRVLGGDPNASNPGEPRPRGMVATSPLMPVASTLRVGRSFDYIAPANSLSVVVIKAAK